MSGHFAMCVRPVFMGAESCERKCKFCGNFWSETFVNNTFGARSLWGEESFVHGTGGMQRRVGEKFKSSGHPHARPKNRTLSPSPARSTWHAAHHAKRPARPTNQYGTQSGGIQQSACAAISNSRKTSWTHLRSSQTCLEIRRSVRLR